MSRKSIFQRKRFGQKDLSGMTLTEKYMKEGFRLLAQVINLFKVACRVRVAYLKE